MIYCREKATEWGVQNCLMRINEILDAIMSVATDDITERLHALLQDNRWTTGNTGRRSFGAD